jgi:hypothetical protein
MYTHWTRTKTRGVQKVMYNYLCFWQDISHHSSPPTLGQKILSIDIRHVQLFSVHIHFFNQSQAL